MLTPDNASSASQSARVRCLTPPCKIHKINGVIELPADASATKAAVVFCRWCSNALPDEICQALTNPPLPCCSSGDHHYTTGEALANFVTHFLCIPGAAYIFYELLAATNTRREAAILSVYGSLLMALFLVSTLYHFVYMLEVWHSCVVFCLRIRPWRQFMLMLDRSTIHLFIAGCYTPWLLLRDHGPFGIYMCQLMWIATISGIVIQHTQLISRYESLVILYLLIGIIPGTFMIICATNSNGLAQVALGGLAYVTGLLFFFSDGYVPYAHAIWHCFVNVGVYLHYRSISDFLLHERLDEPPSAYAGFSARLYAGAASAIVGVGGLALRRVGQI